jgi:hypothetical protein
MIPALARAPDIVRMIELKSYFVVGSPRQSGKTTLLKALTAKINEDGIFYALNIPLHPADDAESKTEALTQIATSINVALNFSNIPIISSLIDNIPSFELFGTERIRMILNFICSNIDKELVVFFDEVDSLPPSVIGTFLSQIRAGYQYRDEPKSEFPRALGLFGLRNLIYYRSLIRPNGYSKGYSKGYASPFNVALPPLIIPDFTRDDIINLYNQHTRDTGQTFSDSALERAWYWTEGQPWLVNALAREIVEKIVFNHYSNDIDGALIDEAANKLMSEDHLHFLSLSERMKEPAIIRVIDAIISGSQNPCMPIQDIDIKYSVALGLVKTPHGWSSGIDGCRVSNRIYQTVILKFLSSGILLRNLPESQTPKWTDGHNVDVSGLLNAFQEWWLENADVIFSDNKIVARIDSLVKHETLSSGAVYDGSITENQLLYDTKGILSHLASESFCVLVLCAYLQGALPEDSVKRELTLGTKSVDIGIVYKGHKYPIEAKLKGAMSREKSLQQLQGYIDKCDATEGWLVVFDRDPEKTLKSKKSWEINTSGKNTKYIVTC